MPRGKRAPGVHEVRPETEGDKWENLGTTDNDKRIRWSAAGPEDLLAAVVAVTEDGAALLLAKTSDGGALCIQVLNGSGRHKLYPSNVAELNEALSLIEEIANSQK